MTLSKDPVFLNIGNTHVQIQYGAAGEIVSVPTKDFCIDSLPADIPCAAACVVPAFLPALKQRNALIINAESAGKLIDFSPVDHTTLGADRIANVCAMLSLNVKLPAVCIDPGTAITFEVLDQAHRFLGGAILPGRKLLRQSLHTGTAQLPDIPLADELPPFPATCTADAIRWGTDGLVVEGVKGMLALLKEKYGDLTCIVTGGDARFLKKYLPGLELAPPDFTLRGVRFVYENF